jgi:hypothetical protein
MTPESAAKKSITDALTAMGIFHLRLQSGVVRKGSRFIHLCEEGTADVVAFTPHPHWLEIKAPGKDGTSKARKQAQSAFADKVKGLGHRHAIVRSVDELVAALEEVNERRMG